MHPGLLYKELGEVLTELQALRGKPFLFTSSSTLFGASLVAQTVNHLPTMQETWVRALGWEDPLENEMATHSSILAWRIPWTEVPGRLQFMRLQRV